MHSDFFLCCTIRHNQDEPQWIVERLLSALTIPEVFKSSAKELSFQQRLEIDHTLFTYQAQIHMSLKQKLETSPVATKMVRNTA